MGLPDSSVEITLATDAVIRRQNRIHMKSDYATDVLSFPSFEPLPNLKAYNGEYLGDILLSLDRARVQANRQKISFENEVLFLIIHSLLHLVGHDHAKPKERLKMQALESQLFVRHKFKK